MKLRDECVSQARRFGWELQKKYSVDSYSSLVESFKDGWLYAVKLELLCSYDELSVVDNGARGQFESRHVGEPHENLPDGLPPDEV